MRLLLDTHALLWFVEADPRLSSKARTAMEDPGSELYISTASTWELAIKIGQGRLRLTGPLEAYLQQRLEQGYRALDIEWRHTCLVNTLPLHHRDPFDRMLAAQALAEDMTLVSADPAFRDYELKLLW